MNIANDNTADLWNAEPWIPVSRDLLEWYEGLFAWGERWRDEALRLRQELEGKR